MKTQRMHHVLGLGFLMLAPCCGLSIGCQESSHAFALTNVSVTLPAITRNEQPLKRAGMPAEPLEIRQGGNQTVLVACERKEDPSGRGFPWCRAFVVVLDGPVASGRTEVTPDNGRLVENSPWYPARSPYVGLDGHISVLRASNKGVVVDCVLRNVVFRSDAPVYSIRGIRTFRLATGEEPELERCAIRVIRGGPVSGEPKE